MRIYKVLIKIILFTLLCPTFYSQENVESFLEGREVLDIAGDGENIWFATNGSGIFKYSLAKKEFTNYNSENSDLQNDFIYCIAANEQFVWAGSIDGFFIYEKRRNRWFKRKFSKGGQLSNWIRSIEYDSQEDEVWIGRFLYLTKYDIRSRRFTDFDLTINKDEKTNTIKTIAVDGDSLVWFGTEGGLHKYNKHLEMQEPGALKYYDNSMNYFNGDGSKISVADILFDRSYVWIGLDKFISPENPEYNIGGLYRYDRRNEWIRFDNTKGLKADGIYAIEITGNYIWTAVYDFSINTKDAYGRGVDLINRFTGKVKTIESDVIPDKVLSMYFDGENMWLGSNSGVVKLNLINQLALWGNWK